MYLTIACYCISSCYNMESDKKVIIGINSLNSCKFEDGKKINLIKSICKYFDYTCHVYVDDDVDDTYIEIECYLSKVESLVVIFKVFDIYIDMVDYVDYNY